MRQILKDKQFLLQRDQEYYHPKKSKQSEVRKQLKVKERLFKLALIAEKQSLMKSEKCFVG